ncbi:MAG: deoxyribose-phosphate aldolase [Bacteroidales bacterium]|nr:deoxyribose-phosphate aldolase [Bacteroidales bacterium]
MSLLLELKQKYPLTISQKEVDDFVAKLKDKQQEYYENPAVQQTIFSCIDLTTLKQTDSKKSVEKFVEKVNSFAKDYPMYTNVGGICLYPNFSPIYKTLKVATVNRAVVAGGFPSSQTFKEIKVLESKMAIEAGATEVDIVIPVGEMLEGNVEKVFDEVKSVKSVLPNNHLKVILETGVLTNIETIWYASVAAMEAGADFIKTSTGKEQQGDMQTAAYVMCQAIKSFLSKNGRKVGFKPAGGIRTAFDATLFYLIVNTILGDEWMKAELFRIGASSLANSSLSRMETLRLGKETEVKYF